MNAATTPARTTGSRRQFWLLVALFFGPLAVAFLLYYGLDGWRPAGSTAQGDLIDPARPLPSAVLRTPGGDLLPADFLRGHWSLVYLDDGACDARCRASLTDIRQVRLALGDDTNRVERILLASDPRACCDLEYFDSEHAGLIVALADGAEGERLLDAFPAYDGVAALDTGRIFVVDPLGNLMMSYDPDAPAKDILKDLKKLLRLSHIG